MLHFRPTLRIAATLALTQPLHGDTGASYDRTADSHTFTVFMREGGWCWFQDPRAIIHRNHLFVGAVQGNASGPALVGVYDLDARAPIGTVTLRDNFKRDDHNSPVFHVRPDGSVLAVYAYHNNNKTHYYRISEPGNPLRWSDELTFEHDYPNAGNVTYMNLVAPGENGTLYNFFRGIDFNPCYITSTDHGKTWGNPTHFIQSELEGRHRPYVRYAGGDNGTVHLSFTDGHPRNFGNNIYYAAFRDGRFFLADGTPVNTVPQGKPLRPSQADLIYRGSGEPGTRADLSAPRSAWTSSIAIDSAGHPHIAYSLYLSNADHRYRLASWDGTRWIDREIAYAGGCLYDRESSYTGLVSLDPTDPSTVVISSDCDPATGKPHSNHEIYRARINNTDDISSIRWTPVTRNSPVRNIRPLVVRDGKRRVILWNRGDFRTYTDYQLDTVGTIETAP